MSHTNPWISLNRRDSILLGAIALAEIMTVFFLAPEFIGRKIIAPFLESLIGASRSPEDGGYLLASFYSFFDLFAHFGSAVLACLLIGLIRRRPLKKSYGLSETTNSFWSLTTLGIFAGLAIAFIPNLLRITDFYFFDIGPDSSMPVAKIGYWLFLAVVSYLLVPFYEEFLTRGYMLGRATENFRPGESIIIIAFLFGFAHVQFAQPNVLSIGMMVSIIMNSVLLGYLVFRTGSLWPSIVAHMIVNIPSAPEWKLVMAGSFVALVVFYRREVVLFLSDVLALLRNQTRWVQLLLITPVPAVFILAVLNKIPFAQYVVYSVAGIAILSLLVPSAWRKVPQTETAS